jgi:hypothetical protein
MAELAAAGDKADWAVSKGSREKKGRLILHNIEKEEQDNILLFFLLYI